MEKKNLFAIFNETYLWIKYPTEWKRNKEILILKQPLKCYFISMLSYKIERNFFEAVAVLILLNRCTAWTLSKRIKKNGNYARMLQAILNKSWKKHLTKQQLYGHLPLISKTIQVRQTRHVGHCWRSKDELISDVLLWTPSHGRPAKTYLPQLYADTRYSLEDLPGAMNDRNERKREREREIVREIYTISVTW